MTETTQKHKMLGNGEQLAITLNVADSGQFFNDNISNRLWNAYVIYNNFCHKYIKPWADYDIYTEISRKGRIHCHGVIRITDYIKYYVQYARKLDRLDSMNVDLDTISDMDKWLEYCRKDSLLMSTMYEKEARGGKYQLTQYLPCARKEKINTKAKITTELSLYFDIGASSVEHEKKQ